MNEPIYFVADVHLSPQARARTEAFLRFLESLPSPSTLFIVGDLFDFWVGPKHALLPDHRRTLRRIRALTKRRVTVKFLYGNRDFYFDARIARRYGMEVLGDEALFEVGGLKMLALHGDSFCTRDHSYHMARRLFRSRPLAALFKALPVSWSYALASLYRSISRWLGVRRDRSNLSFTPEAVQKAFQRGVDVIICGHSHQQSCEQFSTGRTLYILGDWSTRGSYLEFRNREFHYQTVQTDGHNSNTESGD